MGALVPWIIGPLAMWVTSRLKEQNAIGLTLILIIGATASWSAGAIKYYHRKPIRAKWIFLLAVLAFGPLLLILAIVIAVGAGGGRW